MLQEAEGGGDLGARQTAVHLYELLGEELRQQGLPALLPVRPRYLYQHLVLLLSLRGNGRIILSPLLLQRKSRRRSL